MRLTDLKERLSEAAQIYPGHFDSYVRCILDALGIDRSTWRRAVYRYRRRGGP